ncbi:hypothetical protein BJX76DRAFT_268736 [Aspergillus varians]
MVITPAQFPSESELKASGHYHGIRHGVGKDGRNFGTAIPREGNCCRARGCFQFPPPRSKAWRLSGWKARSGAGEIRPSPGFTEEHFRPFGERRGDFGGLHKQARSPQSDHATELGRSHHAPCQLRQLSRIHPALLLRDSAPHGRDAHRPSSFPVEFCIDSRTPAQRTGN